MSFTDLLDDKCDIYHLKTKTELGSFGMPGKETKYYSTAPDQVNIPCHFNKSDLINMRQEEPQNNYPFERKLNLPINTNVKSMDKIVNKMDGIKYYTGIPDNIRNHHISVSLRKVDEIL